MLADRVSYKDEKEDKAPKSITLTDDNVHEVLEMLKYEGKIIENENN